MPKENEAKADIPSDWLPGWSYRTPVIIDNSNTETLTDYQTKITLQGNDPAAPNYIDFDMVLPGGADLRITDSDKVTQLPYWIESWDDATKTAIVWTKVPTIPISSTPLYFKFSTTQTNHDDYGLSYPVTYEFNIPAGSSNLKAYKKYTDNGSWTQIEEKTSSDFFNGIEAVRFDYANNKAYVSVAFDADSNDIYLKVVNGNNAQVGSYQKMTKYYDNRQAAVVVMGDDWWQNPPPGNTDPLLCFNDTAFKVAADAFTSRKIWFTAGVNTDVHYEYGWIHPVWNEVQQKIDAGYLEIASHSSSHRLTPYPDSDYEIGISKNVLISNLNLPYKRAEQEYLYAYLEPYGSSDALSHSKVGEYNYLADRTTDIDKDSLAAWGTANNVYDKIGGSIWLDNSDLITANNKFDAVVNTGGVYHIMIHPRNIDWTEGAWELQHLDRIKEKTNLWYTGFGYLYLYNYTRQQASQRMALSESSIYLYYGNEGAASAPSYDNTFTKDYGEEGLIGLWHMDEGTPGLEVLIDGGLEVWTDSTALTNWTNDNASAGARGIAQESVNKQAGSYALKLTATASNGTNFGVWQDIETVSNQTYQVNFYQYFSARTAGMLKVEAWDNTNNVSLGSQSFTATNSAFSYASFRFASTNTTDVRIKIYLNSETTAGTAYIDAISVKQSIATLTDSSGSNNTGTIYGASRTTTDGGQWGARSDATFSQGSALQFDGKDDYVDAGNNTNLNPGSGDFTISFWSKIDSINSNNVGIIDKNYVTNILVAKNGTTLRVYLHSGTATITSSGYFSLGDWIMTTVVLTNGSRADLFRNGIHLTGANYTGPLASTQHLLIGKYGSNIFDGLLDEVRIYNRALNEEEIYSQYQRRKYASMEPSFGLSFLHTPSSFYKDTTNIVSSSDSYITYSSSPAVSNLVDTDLSLVPSTGSLNVRIDDTDIDVDYVNSTLAGLNVDNIDRAINLNRSGNSSLQITPFMGELDLAIDTWQTSDHRYKKWTESSDIHNLNTYHTIGDLKPHTRYTLKVDGREISTYVADGQGKIAFTYSGGYSTKIFELEETPSAPFASPVKPSISTLTITTLDNGTISLDNLPSSITQIAVSSFPDFNDSSWEDISRKDQLLKKYQSSDTIYIKFRTKEGGVSDIITYKEGSAEISPNNPQTLNDGDIVKTPSSPDVYILKTAGNKKYKRLILSPSVFNFYRHLRWEDIKIISEEELNQYTTSGLVRELMNTIVYEIVGNEDKGSKKPLSQDFDPNSVYIINKEEDNSYGEE